MLWILTLPWSLIIIFFAWALFHDSQNPIFLFMFAGFAALNVYLFGKNANRSAPKLNLHNLVSLVYWQHNKRMNPTRPSVLLILIESSGGLCQAFGASKYLSRLEKVMNLRKQVFAFVLMLVAFGIIVWAQQEKRLPKTRISWEYNTVVEGTGMNFVNLNQLGAEGWELVSVRKEEQIQGDFHQERVYYYL